MLYMESILRSVSTNVNLSRLLGVSLIFSLSKTCGFIRKAHFGIQKRSQNLFSSQNYSKRNPSLHELFDFSRAVNVFLASTKSSLKMIGNLFVRLYYLIFIWAIASYCLRWEYCLGLNENVSIFGKTWIKCSNLRLVSFPRLNYLAMYQINLPNSYGIRI